MNGVVMMGSAPIPIRYLSARAAASSAAHVEEPFLRPLQARPEPKGRWTALPVPDPAGVARRIGMAVLRCPGQGDVQRTVLQAMPDFLWAKLQLLEGVFPGLQARSGEADAPARLGTGRTAELLREASPRALSDDARLAARMGLETLEACNAGFIAAFPRDPNRFLALPEFENYVVGVLAIEMVQIALTLYLEGEGKARWKRAPQFLARLFQSWSEQMYHVSKVLGFFEQPRVDLGALPASDPEVMELAESAWFEACAARR